MNKKTNTPPTPKEATNAILEAVGKSGAPETGLIELYLDTAFEKHRYDQMIIDQKTTMETIKNQNKQS
jgi:hypothetical protein